jgi:hypothetical protein
VIHNYRWWLDLAEREPKVSDCAPTQLWAR